jgi:hypothetical protein
MFQDVQDFFIVNLVHGVNTPEALAGKTHARKATFKILLILSIPSYRPVHRLTHRAPSGPFS